MNDIKKSAGLLIIYQNKILLCHPTKANWQNTFSIPKGHIEKNESIIEAAIRETREETSIKINKDLIDAKNLRMIEYKNKKGEVYKKLFYYPIFINNIDYQIIPKENLQIEEIDWAGFMNKEEAEKKIFWRFKEMLSFIK